jgi:hypothetical protein
MGNIRYVKQAKNGGWDVVKEGHRRATAHGATKQAAISAARDLVSKEGGGEVLVLNRTGKIVRSDTVRRTSRRAAA